MPGIDTVHQVQTKHDIGLVTGARLVAIFWAGLIPVVLPAWIIIRAEIASQNTLQDTITRRDYITRSEFDERMRLLDERARVAADTLREIREEQKAQREILERISGVTADFPVRRKR